MKLSLNVLPLLIWAKSLKNSLFALFVALPIVTVSSVSAVAQSATVTTLAVTSAGSAATTVISPAVVTLTANVTAGGAPVTHGTVNFCYSLQIACSGAGLIGAAQLTASGTAAISIHPAIGTHSYTAVFLGSTSAQASSSASSRLTVNGGVISVGPTATTLAATGNPGSFTLTGTVTANGSQLPPIGILNFIDLTNGSTLASSVTLSNPIQGVGYLNVPASTSLQNTTPMAVGDFNGDGNPDLIAKLANGTITLQIGLGNNSFSTGATIPGGASLVAVGDFNSDGKLDLVTLANGAINVFFGDGAGNFTAAPANTPLSSTAVGISVADFNRDGNLDLVMIDNSSVMVYLGAGDGTFTAGYSIQVVSNEIGETAQSQNGIAVGDFNADGISDIAVAWQIVGAASETDTEFNISFFFGDGAGNFTTSFVTLPADIDPELFGGDPLFGTPPGSMVIVASDLDGDGKTDISSSLSYFACCPGGEITAAFALYNNGDGTFTTTNLYVDLFRGPPVASAAVDTTGNGTPSIATLWADAYPEPGAGSAPPAFIDYGSGTVVVSDATFPTAFLAGAFNGDGIQEIVTGGPIATSLVGYQISSSAIAAPVAVSPPGSGVHQVEATYAGDTIHAASTSAPISLSAVQATPVVTLSASSPIVLGQPVILTATLTSTGTVPIGNVSFLNGAASLGTSILTGGIATLSLNSLASGTYSITASYSGDSNNNPATSLPLSITVPLPTPTLVLTTPAPSTTFGSPITLKATMTVTGTLPTASIAFKNGTTVLGSQALDKTGTATLTVPAPGLPIGTDSITATFAGNSSFSAVTSAPLTVTVAKATPTLVLTSSAPTIAVGSAETLTLALPATDPAPTGTVTFLMGSATLGTGTVTNGSANFTTSTLPAGKDTVTASWSGDDTYTAATSPAIVVMVAPAFTITSAASTIYEGVADTITITLVATGNSIVPTGTITLSSGSYKSSATALSAGSASITIPANTLPAGADTVTATYSGDTNYPAASATITLTASTAPPPNFTISAPSVSLAPGATTSNTVQITLTPVTGFTGAVDLTASITSSPMNATDPPTLSFGSNSSVAITGSAAATATLTIATSAQVISRNTQPSTQDRNKWIASGSAVLACVLLWGIPARRRKGLLAAARNLALLALLAAAAATALSSCGGHSTKITNPGTTPGAYTITVTGKSGALTSTGTVTLTVQ